jgi:N6-L-threonylcarbamoyladenine synthase
MKIIGIETSCDETSVAFVEASGSLEKPHFKTLSHALHSQIDIHAKYGGVFPAEARRAHAENLVPIFAESFEKSGLADHESNTVPKETQQSVREILEREPELADKLIAYAETVMKPEVDMISITIGPGLPPALWVGVNFARALNAIWDIPLVGANHMEGHILSVLMPNMEKNIEIEFPAISLLISGGHTELVYMEDINTTLKIGKTRDDAVGEAFDKVARMIGLTYPGGPKIGKLAAKHREKQPLIEASDFPLPRPMLHSNDYDFSFSGIKTAVLYTIKKISDITEDQKQSIAREFEDSVSEVLLHKTLRAIDEYGAKSLIIGGGVIASPFLRKEFTEAIENIEYTKLYIPDKELATDNAIMIAIAGYRQYQNQGFDDPKTLSANSNLSL